MISAGSFSIHLRTSAARPFLFIQSIKSARSAGLRAATGFTFSRSASNFFSVQLPIEFEAKQIIGESNLLTHLQVLGKVIRALEGRFVARRR